MKRLLVIPVAVAILAAAGQALAQGEYGDGTNIFPSAFSGEGEGIQDDTGNPLAAHSAVAIGVLNPGVTESNIQTLFAQANVQGILNDFDVLVNTSIGVGDALGPGTTNPSAGITDFSLPGYFYGAPGYGFISYSTAESLVGDQVYMLAVNATSLTASAITQMGMWTIKGPADDPTNTVNQWIMPTPGDITPVAISPDPGGASPTNPYGAYPTDTLDAVIGPGEQPCGTGWVSVFNAVWPGSTTVANINLNDGVQLAPVRLPGDANGDGKVDINDLTIVLAHYGQTGENWAEGEFTGDGTVDINDLTIVLAHYNQSQGASAAGMAPVPEPSCLVLLGIGGAGLLACLRRRRR